MTGWHSAPRPVTAEIHPLPPSWSPDINGASGSNTADKDVAYASAELWEALQRSARQQHVVEDGRPDEDGVPQLGIAVEWPEERRLREKGKGKAMDSVMWVEQTLASGFLRATSARQLWVPGHLLPAYCRTPITAHLHGHDPIDLTLAILQPLTIDGNAASGTNGALFEPDFSAHYLREPHNGKKPNGKPQHHPPRRTSRIVRQGDVLESQDHNEVSRWYRVVMTEPVQQGVLTRSTQIILAKTAFTAVNTDIPDGSSDASSSFHKSHLSSLDFDPDAFLSSSLELSLSHSSDVSDGAASSTSGSLTPRPPGSDHRLDSPAIPLLEVMEDSNSGGARFSVIKAMGPGTNLPGERSRVDEICWVGLAGLGRVGVFEGDWVLITPVCDTHNTSSGRLARVFAWEKLDEVDEPLPSNPILMPPDMCRSMFPAILENAEVNLQPTPFGPRRPTLPVTKTITLARIATAQGVDKRYERSLLRGLRRHFSESSGTHSETSSRLVRRGDIISVPVCLAASESDDFEDEEGRLASDSNSDSNSDSDSEDELHYRDRFQAIDQNPTAVAYFVVTTLSYQPLLPPEEDFRSTVSSKARAGELGCWVEVGEHYGTKMVLLGVERERVSGRADDREWFGLARVPAPSCTVVASKLRSLLESCFSTKPILYAFQPSILVKGARGSGKYSMIHSLAEELGYNVVLIECFDIVGDTNAVLEGTIRARLEKVQACAPAILLLHHIEALARKSESTAKGRPPAVVKVIEGAVDSLQSTSTGTGWPCILVGTMADEDVVPSELLNCFKQEILLHAPAEFERLKILIDVFDSRTLAPDVSLKSLATQTAALQSADILALALRAQDLAVQRAMKATGRSMTNINHAGLAITSADVNTALANARSAYSDSIGAPKIPNVSWDDVGGLAAIKKDILDTIQLPLEHPELFAQGLKKRSGILLYGPPGTGKTLLAKAVATSCSLNFFSVKGPELLNMYIGESEANVRRIFQRARDAQPCVIFMDELDSVAPKRGNQGDSGGVMDRIVSQLLAELDGMSSGAGADVYIMGATNRPDLLDPALLRPGRFDRMLYLSPPSSHEAQLDILKALTRKFSLSPDFDMEEIACACPFNLTGADFYALCSDAMLRAMMGKAEAVDRRIEELNAGPERSGFPRPLTTQYYLSTMARPEEIEVVVGQGDFEVALRALVPSVSKGEMEHYEKVQRDFKGFAIGTGANGKEDH